MSNISNLPFLGLSRTETRWIVAIAASALLAGCARHYTPAALADPYGFYSGLWHGIIFPISLMANILSWLLTLLGLDVLSNIQIIGRPNTGFFYYFGFVHGLLSEGTAAR